MCLRELLSEQDLPISISNHTALQILNSENGTTWEWKQNKSQCADLKKQLTSHAPN